MVTGMPPRHVGSSVPHVNHRIWPCVGAAIVALSRNDNRVHFEASIGCSDPSRPHGTAMAPNPRTSGISPWFDVSNDNMPSCTAKFVDFVDHHRCCTSKSSRFEKSQGSPYVCV